MFVSGIDQTGGCGLTQGVGLAVLVRDREDTHDFVALPPQAAVHLLAEHALANDGQLQLVLVVLLGSKHTCASSHSNTSPSRSTKNLLPTLLDVVAVDGTGQDGGSNSSRGIPGHTHTHTHVQNPRMDLRYLSSTFSSASKSAQHPSVQPLTSPATSPSTDQHPGDYNGEHGNSPHLQTQCFQYFTLNSAQHLI